MAPLLTVVGCMLLNGLLLSFSTDAFQLKPLTSTSTRAKQKLQGGSVPVPFPASSWNFHSHQKQKNRFHGILPKPARNNKSIGNRCKYSVQLSSFPNESQDVTFPSPPQDGSILTATSLFLVAFLYWYLLVFGAAAHESNLPVPDWLPLIPGWPPSDADLAPAVEDSIHFFYISDLLETFSSSTTSAEVVPSPPALRLALFNLAEAWIFAFLPLMLADKRKLPLPVLSLTWLGALGLTNAFLAPYLAFREIFSVSSSSSSIDDGVDTATSKNQVLSTLFAVIASIVFGYAAIQTGLTTLSTGSQEWTEFGNLVQTDRTYLAFCIDLVLFGFFQSFLIKRVAEEDDYDGIYNVPFVGLMAWLLRST